MPGEEILELRTLESKHFDNGDGTITANCTGLPQHCDMADDRGLVDINSYLNLLSSNGVVDPEVDVKFTHAVGDHPIDIRENRTDYCIPYKFSPRNVSDVFLVTPQGLHVPGIKSINRITYREAHPGLDVDILVTPEGRKEFYTVTNLALARKELAWKIEGSDPTPYLKSMWFKASDGITVIPIETVYDQSDNMLRANLDTSLLFEGAIIDPTFSVNGIITDGYIAYPSQTSTVWSTVRNASSGVSINSGDTLEVWCNHGGGYYEIIRSWTGFVTSGVVTGATVTLVTLTLYGGGNTSDSMQTVILTTSATALSAGVYNAAYYGSTPLATFDASPVNDTGYTKTLTGLTINQTGSTFIGLRALKDLNNVVPTSNFDANSWIRGGSGSYPTKRPVLAVTYTGGVSASRKPCSIFFGAGF